MGPNKPLVAMGTELPEKFDPNKVRRVHLHADAAYWVRDEDYDALLALHKASLSRERELQTRSDAWYEAAENYKLHLDAAESQLLAKDALIASLKSEISKQNKAEEELLATGEKLAEEKA